MNARPAAALLTLLVCAGASAARAERAHDVEPGRLGLGAGWLGVQARCRVAPRWLGELRYQLGSTGAGAEKVRSHVVGVRGYRHFRAETRWQPYLGAETAWIRGTQAGTGFRTSGFALGGFGGLESRVGRRWATAVDIGPYLLSLKEGRTSASQSSLEFVLNFAIIYYF